MDNKKIKYQLSFLEELEVKAEESVTLEVEVANGVIEELFVKEEGIELDCKMIWNQGSFGIQMELKKLKELLSNKPFSNLGSEDFLDYELELYKTSDGDLEINSVNGKTEPEEIAEELKGTSYEIENYDSNSELTKAINDACHRIYSDGDIEDSEYQFSALYSIGVKGKKDKIYSDYWEFDFRSLKQFLKNEKYSEAIKVGHKFIDFYDDQDEKLAEAYRYIAESYENIENYKKAIEYYQKSLDINETDFCYGRIAKCQIETNDPENAIINFKRAYSLNPQNTWAYLNCAILVANDKKEEAVKILTEGIEYNPTNPPDSRAIYWLYQYRGVWLSNLERYEEAEKDFIRVRDLRNKVSQESAYNYFKLGETQYSLKKYEVSYQNLQKAGQLDSKYLIPYCYDLRGDCKRFTKNYKEAIEEYKKGNELQETDLFLYQIGNCLNLLENYESAIEYFNRALEIDPDDKLYSSKKADCLYNLKKYKEAATYYKNATDIDPKFKYAYKQWGKALHQNRNYEEAIQKQNKAIEIDNSYEWSYLEKAISLVELDRHQEALDCLNSCKFSNVWYEATKLKFELCLYLGKVEQANKIIEAIKDAYPQGVPHVFKFLIGTSHHFKRDYKNALKYYEYSDYSFLRRYLEFNYAIILAENETVLDKEDAFVTNNDDRVLEKSNTDIVVNSLLRRGEIEYYKKSGGYDSEFMLYNYNKALELAPNNFEANFGKARVLLNNKYSVYSKEEGVKLLERCLEIKEHSPVYLELADQTEDPIQALELKLKAVEVNPKLKRGWKSLFKTYFELEEYEKAIGALEQIPKHQEDDRIMADIAISKYHLGQSKEAVEILEKVTTNVTNRSKMFFYLAKASEKIGETDKSKQNLYKALRIPSPQDEKEEHIRFLFDAHYKNDPKLADVYATVKEFLTKGEEERLDYLKSLERMIVHKDDSIFSHYPAFNKELTDYFINKGLYFTKIHLAKNPFISTNSLHTLIENEKFTVLEVAVSNPGISSEDIEGIIANDDGSYRYSFALSGALSNPNIKADQVEKLLDHKYSWVKKKANAVLTKKVDYKNCKDRYMLLGLLDNDIYSKAEKEEIRNRLKDTEARKLLYKLPAEFVTMEQHFLATSLEYDTLKDEVIGAILDKNVDSWQDYIQHDFYDYGESEFGVADFVDKVVIKRFDDDSETIESFALNGIYSFPESEIIENLNLESGNFVHEAISTEVGTYKYSEFELEWEFRPEFLEPSFTDSNRAIVEYNFINPNKDREEWANVNGNLIESRGGGVDIYLYLSLNDGYMEDIGVDFEDIRNGIVEKGLDLNRQNVEKYLENLTKQ